MAASQSRLRLAKRPKTNKGSKLAELIASLAEFYSDFAEMIRREGKERQAKVFLEGVQELKGLEEMVTGKKAPKRPNSGEVIVPETSQDYK
jgi:hypothetical protein